TDYINILLPGHGGTTATFRQYGRHEWEETVQALLDHVLPVYEQIDLVGHSMGCLLWLSSYRQYPDRFHSFLALSCPFALRPTLRYLRNNLLALYDLPVNNVYIQAARKANSLSSRNPFAYLFCLKPYSSLLSMIQSARKMNLRHIRNGFAYVGEKDEIVSPRSLPIASTIGFGTELLPLCGHNYFSPAAKSRIQENFLRMISQSK
ncbi:MAG: alpha/beta hydrolase, partial [Clostridia bacterium]|nr:alpha/beta hydrolase [Clostridia bacterium]